MNAARARAISKPALLKRTSPERSAGEGPKQSGGRRVGSLLRRASFRVFSIAVELKSQYAVAYSRPPKGKATEKLNVSVNRRGVSLRAPNRVPGR